jgi:hypothetical protein
MALLLEAVAAVIQDVNGNIFSVKPENHYE